VVLKRVLVSRQLPGPALGWLADRVELEVWPQFLPPSPDELRERVAGIDGLICTVDDQVDEATLQAAGSQLQVVSVCAAGVNNVDLEAARARGVRVTNTPGINAEATADLAFALLCAVARRVVEAAEYARSGQWQTWHPELFLGPELYQARLGLVGLGSIGQAMARRARGFAMQISYTTRQPRPEAEALGAVWLPLEELLATCDFVSLHVPLTPQTHNLINAQTLALMKPGSILVNTARGPVVDTTALLEALTHGHLGGAGLDVTEPEPLPPTHPLYQLPNVVILPHIGSAGRATRERMASLAVDNLWAVLSGQSPSFAVV
jgi:glyoxylate reductase